MQEKRDYQLSASINEGILEIVIAGKVARETLDSLRSEIMTIMRETNAQAVLNDVRASTGPHDMVDAFFRTRDLPTHVKVVPAAMVDHPGNPEYKSFYETTAANTGMTVKWFTDMESARAWLKDKIDERSSV